MFEGEAPHPETGLPMRMYDTRTFDRVAQVQHSLNELELLAADGSVQTVYRTRSQFTVYLQAGNGTAACASPALRDGKSPATSTLAR